MHRLSGVGRQVASLCGGALSLARQIRSSRGADAVYAARHGLAAKPVERGRCGSDLLGRAAAARDGQRDHRDRPHRRRPRPARTPRQAPHPRAAQAIRRERLLHRTHRPHPGGGRHRRRVRRSLPTPRDRAPLRLAPLGELGRLRPQPVRPPVPGHRHPLPVRFAAHQCEAPLHRSARPAPQTRHGDGPGDRRPAAGGPPPQRRGRRLEHRGPGPGPGRDGGLARRRLNRCGRTPAVSPGSPGSGSRPIRGRPQASTSRSSAPSRPRGPGRRRGGPDAGRSPRR